jgi:hypothetical protein
MIPTYQIEAFLQFTYLELDQELAQSLLNLVKNGKNSGNNNDSHQHGEKMRRGKF